MIPESTTLTAAGRQLRNRILWGLGALLVLVALAFAFIALDRSTVVDGPDGSSFVTTATGLAALADTLERDARTVTRLQRPLDPAVTSQLAAYIVADAGFGQYEAVETAALRNFVEGGGSMWILGVPPRGLVETFDLDVEWVGRTVGRVAVTDSLAHTSELEATRFGAFAPGHGGEVVAPGLVVRFRRGEGTVVLVSDSSVGHNATIDRADNVDLFGDLLGPGPIAFDEYRHGYRDEPTTTGMLDAAPGNWEGALAVGAVVLVLALTSYGRRLGPPEPTERRLAPDRAEYIDALAHQLRRAGPLPADPLRNLVAHKLGVASDADLAAAVRAAGIEPPEDLDSPQALDRVLADLSRRPT